jgi:outer membrane protein TolC
MRVQHMIRAGSGIGAVALLVGLVSISGRQVFASGQAPAPAPALAAAAAQAVQQAATQPAAPVAGPARRLTVDEAVSMALESNLGIKADRLGPQIEDDAVAQARGAFAPNVFSGLTRNSNTQQTQSFTQAASPTFTNTGFTNTTGIQQRLPWAGGSYDIRWTGARSETTAYSNFNPQLSSSLTFNFQQPLLRNFSTDANRRAVWNTENLRRIADLRLRQSIVSTTRTVRNAYWDLVGAMANLQVAQQSLDLARQSLKDNQTRVEVGTMAPIDIVEAQAEVARNEESVIVAQSLIENAQDNLRVLIMNPDLPDFWTTRFEPAETAELKPVAIDIDKAVTTALADRTDLLTAKRQLDNTQIDVHYYRNQRLPSVDLNLTYGLTGTGGTQFTFGDGYPPQIESQTVKGFGSVLGDVFHRVYPAWTLGFQIGYPIGTSQADAALAGARLQQTQAQTNLRNLELQVAASVRNVGRQVETNLKRVEATQKARELAERRLEAEQKKFSVGLTSSFIVFQVQRDLAVARFNELAAIIDYNKSLVNFAAVQETPLQ